MYGIFTYIYHKNQPNVGKYAIHGSYGNRKSHRRNTPGRAPIFQVSAMSDDPVSCVEKMELTSCEFLWFSYQQQKNHLDVQKGS